MILWARLYADLRLGFKENTLYQLLKNDGFCQTEVSVVARDPQAPGFETILASGFKPA